MARNLHGDGLLGAVYRAGDDMNHLAASTIHASLWQLYKSGKLSDLTVTCGPRKYQVHKAIVCAQSPFFDKACTSGFKEGIEGIIDLSEEDPDILECFFQFLYAGNYSDGEHFELLPSKPAMMSPESMSGSNEPSFHLEMAPTGQLLDDDPEDEDYLEEDKEDEEDEEDEEDTDSLEYDSEEPYESPVAATENCDVYPVTSIRTSLRVYVMADKYDVHALQMLAMERFTHTTRYHGRRYADFPAVVGELFETTMSGDPLQDLVCEIILDWYRYDKSVWAKMKPIMEKHAGLAICLLEKSIKR